MIGIALAVQIGCSKPNERRPSGNAASENAPKLAHIIAQGQIMPADGIIKLYTTPGDVVEKLDVKVGKKVKKGDSLAVMRSESSIKAQQATLEEKKRGAILEHENGIKQAELRLSAAQLKLEQLQSQRQTLVRQSRLIEDGQQQLAASKKILERLTAIASDKLTREFVGQLEVEKQSLSVGEARGKLAQQESTRDQAEVDLNLGEQAALAEIQAAKTLLELAHRTNPEAAFDAQLEALQVERSRAVLLAPFDGTILAVNATVGGTALQSPLIELANLQTMVVELEVNVGQARLIRPGQTASITSDSLSSKLTAKVVEKSQVVGQPKLRSLDPLAAVDYRTLSVIAELEDPEEAQHWLRLQVEATIDVDTNSR